MRFRSLHIQGYGIHADRLFSFAPEVNLLVGDNGAGKSTVLHAMAWCIWGQKLRGLELSRCSVNLTWKPEGETIPTTLLRQVTSGGERVTASTFGLQQANKTRASEVLQSVFGDFRSWRRSLYVTGKEASRFASGTPSEKLGHLVHLIGASEYDKTIEKLRGVRREAERRVGTCTARVAGLTDGLHAKHRQFLETLQERERHRANQVPARPSAWEYSTASRLYDRLHTACSELQREITQSRRTISVATSALTAAKREAHEVVPCPTCHRPWRESTREGVNFHELEGLAAEAEQHHRQLTSRHTLLACVRTLASNQLTKIREQQSLAEYHHARAQDLDRGVGFAAHAYGKALVDFALAREQQRLADDAAQDVSIAVFAMEAARYRYLVQHRAHIEAMANAYLTEIGSPIQIGLVLENDALAVCTTGVLASTYDECSSGEQRRIDLCLLLAMSHVAASVGTLPKGAPLFIDEAFDTLDESGREALVHLALAISKTRQVFLVSHVDPTLPVDGRIAKIVLE